MKKKSRIIMMVILVLCVSAMTFHTSSTALALEGKEIKIGVAVPITGHGANVGKREDVRPLARRRL
jgi:ABC-type branched-subunit amino acid transport system substrate-binding protein